MSKTISLSINKTVNCSKEVIFWNYWDHEHLDVVHGGYTKSDILYEFKNSMFRIDKMKIPFVPFLKIRTIFFMVQQDPNTLITYASQLGILSMTVVRVEEFEHAKCKVNIEYNFQLEGFQMLFEPVIKFMLKKWNNKVWSEDLKLKLRRQKVINLGFKDFKGLPNQIADRKPSKYELKLPLPRPINSTRDQHPFSYKKILKK